MRVERPGDLEPALARLLDGVLVVVAGLVLTAWLFLRLERIISPTVNGLAVTATDEQPVR